MGLMDRVASLIRANLNDLVDRAEDPQKMLKQVILDMQSQLLQVKTQVAMAMADHHVLGKKLAENEEAEREWVRKADLALEKDHEDLARAALERALTYQQLAMSFRQQVGDQGAQVESLKSALIRLEQKLVEAQAKSELLIAQHRRARALNQATDARAALNAGAASSTFERMRDKVQREEALGQAKSELEDSSLDDRLLSLGREDQVEQMLQKMKQKRLGAGQMPALPSGSEP